MVPPARVSISIYLNARQHQFTGHDKRTELGEWDVGLDADELLRMLRGTLAKGGFDGEWWYRANFFISLAWIWVDFRVLSDVCRIS